MLLAGLGSRAWIGGVTGDILGATTQLVEIGVLVLLLGLAALSDSSARSPRPAGPLERRRIAFSCLASRPSSVIRSSGERRARRSPRWSSTRTQSSSIALIRSSSARITGSTSRGRLRAPGTASCPAWIFGATTPDRWASSKLHDHFVRGHSPKPPAPGLYGSSWQAPKRLGSESDGLRISSPRSCRNASASSSVSSARLGDERGTRGRGASWSSATSTLVYSRGWRAPRSSRSGTRSSRATRRTRTAAGSRGGWRRWASRWS